VFKRIYHAVAVLFVVCLFVPPVQAYEECHYMIVEDYSVIAGGVEWRHIEYGWVCWESGGGGNPGDTGGGGDPGDTTPPQPPTPPTVRVVSASDENPGQVTLNFEIGGGPANMMILMKNGQVVSQGAPASHGFYGSLDNMVFDSILSVSVCNAGGCAEDYAEVRRRTSRPRAEGAITAQWADLIPMDPYSFVIKVGYENYTRILDGEFYLADYSVGTVGMRNGYAKHVQTADALLWENGKREPEWEAQYQMVPYWGWWHVAEGAYQTPGCYVATNRLPNQSALCTTIGEFGHAWYPGTGVISRANAVGSGFANPNPEGQTSLDLWP